MYDDKSICHFSRLPTYFQIGKVSIRLFHRALFKGGRADYHHERYVQIFSFVKAARVYFLKLCQCLHMLPIYQQLHRPVVGNSQIKMLINNWLITNQIQVGKHERKGSLNKSC